MTVSAGAGSWVLLDGFNLFVQKPSRKKARKFRNDSHVEV